MANLYYRVGNKIAISNGKYLYNGYSPTKLRISAGYKFSTFLRFGQIWTWGLNTYGQLGNNSVISEKSPVSILGNKKFFCEISAGGNHVAGIYSEGDSWIFGYNAYGQLGDRTIVSKSTPVAVQWGVKGTAYDVKISSGENHTSVISSDGKIWSWGYNNYGQLGNNTTDNKCSPVQLSGSTKTFCEIDCGKDFTVAIDKNEDLWAWGMNALGQLGNNSGGLGASEKTPVQIYCSDGVGPGGINYKKISSGENHTIALGETNADPPVPIIYTWGGNVYGQLGNKSTSNKSTPVTVSGATKTWCEISAGVYHSACLDYRGQVWCWGYNNFGQLGINNTLDKCTPVSILGSLKTFCKISSGEYHTLAVDNRGFVWGWGSNYYNQLGDNHRYTPVSIHGTYVYYCYISAGVNHSIGVRDVGSGSWCWGNGSYGQLGDNSIESRLTPVNVYNAFGFTESLDNLISAGSGYTCCINKDGLVYCWGYNVYGQLGNNSVTSVRTPVSILGALKVFCKITSGYFHNLAIDSNSKIWSWGYNASGQLGDNSTTNRSTPVIIYTSGLSFCEVAAGNAHSMALVLSVPPGTKLFTWGNNNYGQLGQDPESIPNRQTPISILGSNKTFCKISCGYSNSTALDQYGQIWCWGRNNFGQLGDNSTNDIFTPVSILGAKKTFCKISNGDYHTIAIDKNGRIWCWGNNDFGQLGNNSITSKKTPVSINGSNKTFCKIAGGSNFTIAIDKNGKVWSWGYDGDGQLGNNYTTKTPVRVCGL